MTNGQSIIGGTLCDALSHVASYLTESLPRAALGCAHRTGDGKLARRARPGGAGRGLRAAQRARGSHHGRRLPPALLGPQARICPNS